MKIETLLPFDDTVKTVALFGSGARRTLKGGTGSGDVNARSFTTIEQGLLEQGLLNAGCNVISTPWLDEFDAAVDNAKADYYEKIRNASKQSPFSGLLTMMSSPFHDPKFVEELMQYPADAAVYVISRGSGEGSDRKLVESDYYLNKQEVHDITLFAEHYGRFALLLNTGGLIDLSSIKNLPDLGAILQGGERLRLRSGGGTFR